MITDAVAAVVRRQVETGIDVVSDGEMSKISYATYVCERLTGDELYVPAFEPGDTGDAIAGCPGLHAGEEFVGEHVHVGREFLHAGTEVVVAKERRDRDGKTGRGREQRGGHAEG